MSRTQIDFSLLLPPLQNHCIVRNKSSLNKFDGLTIVLTYENGILNSNTSIVPLDGVIMWLAN